MITTVDSGTGKVHVPLDDQKTEYSEIMHNPGTSGVSEEITEKPSKGITGECSRYRLATPQPQ